MDKEELKKYTAEYLETWYAVACPHCGEKNWINDGDTTDLTARSSCEEGWKCWSCGEKFVMPADDLTIRIEGYEYYAEMLEDDCSIAKNMVEADGKD